MTGQNDAPGKLPGALSAKKMTEINPVEQYFLQKTSEANYGLWNAILTINGIILSAFSMVIAFTSRFNGLLTAILICLCSLSILLILWNYISTKQHYLKIGERLRNPNKVLGEDEKKSDIDRSYRKHKMSIYRENIALFSLIAEVLLIICIVFSVSAGT